MVVAVAAGLRAADLAAAPPVGAEASTVAGVVELLGLPGPGVPEAGSGGGVWQLAALTWLSRGLDRHVSAVIAIRETELVVAVVAAVLLWVLARRVGLGRLTATAAVAAMALCPLAVALQRLAVPQNLAGCWVLAALVVVAGPVRPTRWGGGMADRLLSGELRRDLAAALLVVAAGVTAPTMLLVAPAVVVVAGRRRPDEHNRAAVWGLRVAAVVAAAVVTAGVLLPIPRGPAGWTEFDWGRLGWWSPMLAVVCAVVGLGLRRLRPVAASFVLLMLGAGLPTGSVVTSAAAAVPLAALLVVGTAAAGLEGRELGTHRRQRLPSGLARWPLAPLAVSLAAMVTVPAWGSGWASLSGVDAEGPALAARQWMADQGLINPPVDSALSDPGMWAELRHAGWGATAVTTPTGCTATGCPPWLITTEALGEDAAAGGPLTAAIRGSTTVAVFGRGVDRVEIRHRGGLTAEQTSGELRARAAAGQVLAGSSRLVASAPVRALLQAGRVDPRVIATLATMLAGAPVGVLDLPAVPGEDPAGQPRRQLLLAVPPTGARAMIDFFTVQHDPFRPQSLSPVPAGLLVRYPPLAPPGLLVAYS